MTSSKRNTFLLWLIAFLITLFAAYYQRTTGPTYPVKGKITLDEQQIAFKLPRSYGGDGDAPIKIAIPDSAISAVLMYRRYKSHDEWSEQVMKYESGYRVGYLPHQPPAGKVMYQIKIISPTGQTTALTEEPVILRFKGHVPPGILIPHILLMFLAMLFSTRAGLEALFKGPRVVSLTLWTVILFFLGGMILGPIVQKFAFNAYWTGWPFGTDLTDNKTLVAFLFWLAALWRVRKRPDSRGWVIAAAVVLLAVYLIPHSLLGSEIDYTKIPEQA